MPRIDAPTVVEHHAMRRAALLEAAETVLADQGAEALTLAAVGQAAGLARSSVYQYFSSTAALMAAVVEDAFPRGTQRRADAVDAAASPRSKVDAYVITALDMATDRTHRSLQALSHADLPVECRARMGQLHMEQSAPLREALDSLGDPDPDVTARLVLGVVRAASTLVDEGVAVDVARDRALDLVHEGVIVAR